MERLLTEENDGRMFKIYMKKDFNQRNGRETHLKEVLHHNGLTKEGDNVYRKIIHEVIKDSNNNVVTVESRTKMDTECFPPMKNYDLIEKFSVSSSRVGVATCNMELYLLEKNGYEYNYVCFVYNHSPGNRNDVLLSLKQLNLL